jgi:non-heme chloroperoxidase
VTGQAPARGTVTTSDGTQLSWTQAGHGRPVVLVHGWCQSAAGWKHQLEGLAGQYRVIAYDQRGHGRSAKPAHGHTIHRLAADLHDLLTSLGLGNVILAGHSMGCSVAWAYLELFGPGRLAALVLADGAPCLTARPGWPERTRADAGARFTPAQLARACAALTGPADQAAAARAVTDSMLSPAAPETLRAWLTRQNLLVPRGVAAKLLYHHASSDWRDLIPRITVPTLVTGGRASLIPCAAAAWTARHIPGAQLEIFAEAEGGHHLPHLENPGEFNRLLTDFIAAAGS